MPQIEKLMGGNAFESTMYGGIWSIVGLIVLLWMLRFFRKPMMFTLGDWY
ncbi:MAG: hypothetical protein ACO3AY_02025 [Chitinophagaceae bacterium]